MAAPGLSDAAPPRTVERSTSTSCPLSVRTTIQLPAMTLTVPRSSVQRGPSPAGSGSFTAIDFSAAGGAGVGDSPTRGAAGAETAAVGGSGAGFAGAGVVADSSTLAGKDSVLGEPGGCAAGAGAGALAGALTWGMSASASAAASPEPKAIAAISCGLAASVPRTVTRPPALSGPDPKRFAALTSA